jgi:exodeoxyribonuclease V beta subunit
MRDLDLTGIPLDGAHLIEASAGTGKTYAIGSLYLRLLLEKGLTVDKILVVTYTVAATQELTNRIRENIRKALSAFLKGSSDDAFISELLSTYPDHNQAVLILDYALKLFDEAAIFTIHGFCQRILTEMAFESRNLFDAELITDQQDILLEVVDDFYRKQFTGGKPFALVRYARTKKITPESLMKLVSSASLDAEIIPRIKRPDIGPYLDAYRYAFEQVKDNWGILREDIEMILLTDDGLNRNKYRKKSILKWIEAMNEFSNTQGDDLPLFNAFEKFTTSTIAESMKDGHSPPEHAFFDLCEDLKNQADELVAFMDEYLIWLKCELFDYVRDHLAEKKEKMGVIFFNDLLLKVRAALASSVGPSLISALRGTYHAALIDEFQDTDPIQYEIFKRVFDGLPMFLIGDPKQAIYSFRGADIFTYLNAAKGISEENKHTLKKNWRSEEDLIHAVNRIFLRAGNDNPFVFDQIGFAPAEAADKENRAALQDSQGAPLILWFVRAAGDALLNKNTAEQVIARAVSLEISRLLDRQSPDRVLIDGEPVEPSDIAVLVRENRQARLVRDELAGYGIPCVVFSDENVFESWEAFEMEVLLKAISQPHSESLVRAALATSIMGLSSHDIDDLTKDEAAWEECLIRFRRYHERWASRGFVRMFRELIASEQVRQKVLAVSRGERMLTNFLHLAELMNQACMEKRLGMSDLLKWLALQRETSPGRTDEYQLRLESDENAVKIQTVHKSKGLEYPIVFSPFSWGASMLRDNDHFSFHDRDSNWKETFELGSERIEENRRHAEKELLAENMRLLYVAITRAKNRCYVVWGAINNVNSSALAYLLHHAALPSDSDGIEPLKQMGLNAHTMKHELSDLVTGPLSPILIQDIPQGRALPYARSAAGDNALIHRRFSGTIDRFWKVSSFSALTSEAAHAGEAPDYDALYLRPAQVSFAGDGGKRDIFNFPRGARPGIMMHELFEKLDFLSDDLAISARVSDTLAAYGYDLSWQEVIAGMVKKVLAARIDDFCLAQVKEEQRLNELEFYFPLSRVSKNDLAKCFLALDTEEIPSDFPALIGDLHFDPVHGFMRGFIDLFFCLNGRYYLVDWKSNYLGSEAADYNTIALETAMTNNYYILQYHLYTIAVHHYLKKRLHGYSYDEHFGGVIYVFLRGVDPELKGEYGIYRARPSAEFIERLSGVLTAGD